MGVVAIPSDDSHAHLQAIVVVGDHSKICNQVPVGGGSRPQCMGVVSECPASMRLALQVLWSDSVHGGAKWFSVASRNDMYLCAMVQCLLLAGMLHAFVVADAMQK